MVYNVKKISSLSIFARWTFVLLRESLLGSWRQLVFFDEKAVFVPLIQGGAPNPISAGGDCKRPRGWRAPFFVSETENLNDKQCWGSVNEFR